MFDKNKFWGTGGRNWEKPDKEKKKSKNLLSSSQLDYSRFGY